MGGVRYWQCVIGMSCLLRLKNGLIIIVTEREVREKIQQKPIALTMLYFWRSEPA